MARFVFYKLEGALAKTTGRGKWCSTIFAPGMSRQMEQQSEETAEPGYVALNSIPIHFLVGESIEVRNGVWLGSSNKNDDPGQRVSEAGVAPSDLLSTLDSHSAHLQG